MDSGICYTQSGGVKKYEEGLFSFSPDRVKFTDIDNYLVKPFIPYLFTSSSHPPEVSLEEGTVMYFVAVRNIDNSNIDLSTYLTYTPPDGYELVSEDHKYDTGVKEYYLSKYFYCEPFTVYYGTAGKTFSDLGLSAGKYFYYKKKDSKVYVKLEVSNDIIINGNTYSPGENKPIINTINLESGYGSVTKILVSLDSNHYTGSFNISFDGAYRSNEKIYLLVNNQYYDMTNTTSGKRCHISSKYQNGFHVVGDMDATNGFVYNFKAIDSVNNGLLFLSTPEGIKDSSGRYIPGGVKAKFVVKFTLNNGYYHQDCQLTVDITSGNIKQ